MQHAGHAEMGDLQLESAHTLCHVAAHAQALAEVQPAVLAPMCCTCPCTPQELFKKLALDLDREGKAIPLVETAFSRVGLSARPAWPVEPAGSLERTCSAGSRCLCHPCCC